MEKGPSNRTVSIEAELRAAKDSGLLLTIKYHGGSQPGTLRQIYPLSISRDKIRAQCVTSNAVKLFCISKIELVDPACLQDAKTWTPPSPWKVTFDTLAAVCGHYRETLESQGWTICASDTSIALHRCFKNGKLHKGPDVVLCFEEEYVAECWIDDDGTEHSEWKKRKRPWVVRGKGGRCLGLHKDLDRAADTFIGQARSVAPNSD